uniref:9-cis-epoxycarotenoid dioxygenase n=1 Tax=Rhodosorus marinus TaxID=101924 RepID=A0A7S3A0T4_9RHOD|mmetsp:Transcript_4034/g.16932  ORF Transcript_4034/g.16932 Transcript_4034/m.16932 type:complete len:551 (+) Transcript_4034:94-1746(+)
MSEVVDGGVVATPGKSIANVLNKAYLRCVDFVSGTLNIALGTLGGDIPDKNVYLKGRYAPLTELFHEIDCELLEGALPESLTGAYMRNGPNAALVPEGGYHMFDGDGMVHAVRFRDGKVSFSNRYVQTKRLQMELSHGRPVFLKIGDFHGVTGLCKVLLAQALRYLNIVPPPTGLYHTANTSIVYHAKKVLALGEVGAPYNLRMLCNGIVETLGAVSTNIDGSTSFTAHPKIDPDSDEMVTFGYNVEKKPFVRVGFVDADGNAEKTIQVYGVSRPVMIHDMALTKNYVFVFDMPLIFDPVLMVKENKLPFVLREDIPGRFGLLRRDAVNDRTMEWFEVPGGSWLSHEANAWEDEESKKVHLVAIKISGFDLETFWGEEDWEKPHLAHWSFDLETKDVTHQRLLSDEGQVMEFPVINPRYRGKKAKYVWVTLADPVKVDFYFVRIGKVNVEAGLLDADDGLEAVIHLPPGLNCGEMRFVPRHEDPNMCDGEDDGFLIGYAHENDNSGAYFVAYDAKTMSSNMLCKFRMPTRIPFGFHGYHINESEFVKQLA